MLESTAKEQLVGYSNKINFLHSMQYGFREKSNTESVAFDIVSFVQGAIDSDKAVSGLFIDLERAFEIVDHKLHLNKIQTLGAHYTVVDWFGSYLSNRKQAVKINNALSEFKTD